jgi:hypothetical protein
MPESTSPAGFPADPLEHLKDKADIDTRRLSVQGILESYHSNYDALSEAIQNAVDAVEDAKLEGLAEPYLIEVTVNLAANWISVLDTGLGMTLDQVLGAYLHRAALGFLDDEVVKSLLQAAGCLESLGAPFDIFRLALHLRRIEFVYLMTFWCEYGDLAMTYLDEHKLGVALGIPNEGRISRSKVAPAKAFLRPISPPHGSPTSHGISSGCTKLRRLTSFGSSPSSLAIRSIIRSITKQACGRPAPPRAPRLNLRRPPMAADEQVQPNGAPERHRIVVAPQPLRPGGSGRLCSCSDYSSHRPVYYALPADLC